MIFDAFLKTPPRARQFTAQGENPASRRSRQAAPANLSAARRLPLSAAAVTGGGRPQRLLSTSRADPTAGRLRTSKRIHPAVAPTRSVRRGTAPPAAEAARPTRPAGRPQAHRRAFAKRESIVTLRE